MTEPESNSNHLPENWTRAMVKEIAKTVRDGTHNPPQRVESGYALLSARNVKAGLIDWDEDYSYISEEDYLEINKANPLENQDVLLTIVGTIGRSCVNAEVVPFTVQRSVGIIKTFTNLIDPYYLQHLFNGPSFRKSLEKNSKGTAQQGIYLNSLKNIEIPLAPLPEQHRIVARIEELFSRLDAGVQALQKARAQLQRYRQSVLKAAVEGRLTAEWRAAHPEVEPAEQQMEKTLLKRSEFKTKRPETPETSDLPKLPRGWLWASLDQLSWDSGYGTSAKCDYDFSGPPVLRIPNIVGGNINLDDIKNASSSAKLNPHASLSRGDLLVIRTNGSKNLIGRGAVVTRDFDRKYFFASYLVRFRLIDVGIIPIWIGSIFQSTRIRSWIEHMAATSAGQYNISLTTLNRLPIEIPPTEEQQIILKEMESILCYADEIEATLNDSVQRADSLRQSILKRAFQGKLVPQDPNDKPASLLLERIKAEREKPSPPRGRRRSINQASLIQ